MERQEVCCGAESKIGRRSQRIVWGECDHERNSLGCGNSLSLSPAADADRAKAPVSRRLRLSRGRLNQNSDPCHDKCNAGKQRDSRLARIYGLGTTLQLVPSQCWMIELLIIHPTAHTSSLATAAASFIEKLVGAGMMLHAVPFQCSVRVFSPLST